MTCRRGPLWGAMVLSVLLGGSGCHWIFSLDDVPATDGDALPLTDVMRPELLIPDLGLDGAWLDGPSVDSGIPSNTLWSRRFGGAGDDVGYGVAVDASGQVTITGSFTGSSTDTVSFGGETFAGSGIPSDIFLASFDSAGQHRWSKAFIYSYATFTRDSAGRAVSVDQSGNVYVTGSFAGAVDFGGGYLSIISNRTDVFLASYYGSGAYRWSEAFPASAVYGDNAGRGLAVDQSNQLHVTGGFAGTVDFGTNDIHVSPNAAQDIFIGRYAASDGSYVQCKDFGDAGTDVGHGMSVAGGRVAATGEFEGTVDLGNGPVQSAGASDVFVSSHDVQGGPFWANRFGGPGRDVGRAVAVDDEGNVYITGEFQSAADFGGGPLTSAGGSDIFLACFSADGVHLWSKRFGDTLDDIAHGVAVDASGNVTITGEFQGTVDFGGGPLTAAGDLNASDIFVARYTSDGDPLWSTRFGGIGVDVGRAVAVDRDGNVHVTGEFQRTVDFGNGPLESAGASDIFLVKLAPRAP